MEFLPRIVVKEQSISFKYTENCFNGSKVVPPFYELREKNKTDIIVKIEEHKALIVFVLKIKEHSTTILLSK